MRPEDNLHYNIIYKQKKSYLGIRLLGSLMVLMVAAVALIIFLNFAKENSPQPISQNPNEKTTSVTSNKNSSRGTEHAKYSFYDQLQERSKEVQKEIDHQRQIAENRKPIKGRNYRVQVGAFRNPDQADKMQQRMLLMKLPARIIRSGEFHLVQVGPYANVEDAQKIQKDLEADNIKTLIKTFVDN